MRRAALQQRFRRSSHQGLLGLGVWWLAGRGCAHHHADRGLAARAAAAAAAFTSGSNSLRFAPQERAKDAVGDAAENLKQKGACNKSSGSVRHGGPRAAGGSAKKRSQAHYFALGRRRRAPVARCPPHDGGACGVLLPACADRMDAASPSRVPNHHQPPTPRRRSPRPSPVRLRGDLQSLLLRCSPSSGVSSGVVALSSCCARRRRVPFLRCFLGASCAAASPAARPSPSGAGCCSSAFSRAVRRQDAAGDLVAPAGLSFTLWLLDGMLFLFSLLSSQAAIPRRLRCLQQDTRMAQRDRPAAERSGAAARRWWSGPLLLLAAAPQRPRGGVVLPAAA